MSEENWQALIREFCPTDKQPCNCGNAYAVLMNGLWRCEHGCGAGCAFAREYIADCIIAQRASSKSMIPLDSARE